MAQQGKIEFSFWYSLAKWHRTVDRQPAAMRTCRLQTWTHMSENAQNIAFFTRFVGAESAGLSINYILLLASLLRAIVLQYVISFLAFISYIDILYWLVVWNIFAYTGNNHPNWRTHIFQRGRLKPPTRNPICVFYLCWVGATAVSDENSALKQQLKAQDDDKAYKLCRRTAETRLTNCMSDNVYDCGMVLFV